MRTVNHRDIIATPIRYVNLIRDGVRCECDRAHSVLVYQCGRGVLRAINHRNIAWIAALRIAKVRHVDEVRVRIHGHGGRRSSNRDRRDNRVGPAVNYSEVVALRIRNIDRVRCGIHRDSKGCYRIRVGNGRDHRVAGSVDYADIVAAAIGDINLV